MKYQAAKQQTKEFGVQDFNWTTTDTENALRAISNTSQTKEVRLAQRKLLKRKQTQTGDYLSQKNSGIIMGRDPNGVLSMSMQSSQVALGDILSQTNPEFIKKQGQKKRKNDTTDGVSEAAKKKQKADSETIEEGMVDGESKEDSILNDMIFLPIPMEGKFQYSPMEAVAYISHLVENPSCDKCYVKAYKNKIIERNLVPVKNSQLNSVVKQYGGKGKAMAPMSWSTRGVFKPGWDSLVMKYQAAKQQIEFGVQDFNWTTTDTENALRAISEGSGVLLPCTPGDIKDYHSLLMSMQGIQDHIKAQLQIQQEGLKDIHTIIPLIKQQKNRKMALLSSSKVKKSVKYDKNDPKYDGITLPEPAGGNSMYTPAEAIANILTFSQSKPTPNKGAIRAFKEKMIATRLIPVAISQLNSLISKHSGPDKKEPAPRCWNLKGRAEIINIDDLAQKVHESHFMWTIDKTRDAVWAEKKLKEGSNAAKKPDVKTVNAYHSALLSIPEVADKVVKPTSWENPSATPKL